MQIERVFVRPPALADKFTEHTSPHVRARGTNSTATRSPPRCDAARCRCARVLSDSVGSDQLTRTADVGVELFVHNHRLLCAS